MILWLSVLALYAVGILVAIRILKANGPPPKR